MLDAQPFFLGLRQQFIPLSSQREIDLRQRDFFLATVSALSHEIASVAGEAVIILGARPTTARRFFTDSSNNTRCASTLNPTHLHGLMDGAEEVLPFVAGAVAKNAERPIASSRPIVL